jgi:hypothetical protein
MIDKIKDEITNLCECLELIIPLFLKWKKAKEKMLLSRNRDEWNSMCAFLSRPVGGVPTPRHSAHRPRVYMYLN